MITEFPTTLDSTSKCVVIGEADYDIKKEYHILLDKQNYDVLKRAYYNGSLMNFTMFVYEVDIIFSLTQMFPVLKFVDSTEKDATHLLLPEQELFVEVNNGVKKKDVKQYCESIHLKCNYVTAQTLDGGKTLVILV